MRDDKRLKGKGEFPSTEDLIELIHQRKYTSIRSLCRGEHYKRSSFQDDLKDRGQLAKIAVLEALEANRLEGKGKKILVTVAGEQYPAEDPRQEPENETYYTAEDVKNLLKNEKDLNTTLSRKLRQTQGKLYDRDDAIRVMAHENRVALQGIYTGTSSFYPHRTRDIVKDALPGDPLWTAHVPQADVHAGKYVWGQEAWGRDYDTDEACERIVRHCRMVAQWVKQSYGVCDRIYMTDLGDLFHALDGKTENGTFLHQDTRARRVYRHTLQAKYEGIDILRNVVPHLTLVQARGNHDYLWHDMAFEAIAARYYDADDVEVLTSATPASYFVHSKACHVIDHGRGISALSTPKARLDINTTIRETVPLSVIKEHDIEHFYFYVGHLHYREVYEDGNVEMIRLPAITEPDDYEQGLRLHSKPGAIAYRLDNLGYIDQEKRFYF